MTDGVEAFGSKKSVVLTGRELPLPPGVTIPAEDGKLEVWGSKIHWTDIYVIIATYGSRKVFKWYVPVTCGACGLKHNRRIFKIKPTSGILTPECLRDTARKYRQCDYTGLCSSCLVRLVRVNHPNLALPDGSELFFTQRTQEGLPFFCGNCKESQVLKCDLSVDIFLSNSDWYCPNCDHVIGQHQHKTGATVFWFKRKAEPAKAGSRCRIKVGFICLGCRQLRYAREGTIRSAVWMGRCDECHMHPRTITGKRMTPLGATIPFDDREGQTVRLKCPLPGCPKTNSFAVGTAKKSGFLGICKTHGKAEIALAYQSQTQEGNLDQPTEGRSFQNFLEAVHAVAIQWATVRRYSNLTFKKRVDMITQNDLGPTLGVHQIPNETDKNYRNRVARKLKSLGVSEVFPGSQGGFPTFVEAVVKALNEGAGAQSVARLLWMNRIKTNKTRINSESLASL